MRENRTCSSEGGEPGDRASLPYPREMVKSLIGLPVSSAT